MGKKFNGKLISNGDVLLFAFSYRGTTESRNILRHALLVIYAGLVFTEQVLSRNCMKFCGNTRAEINSCPNYENLKSFRKEPRGGIGVINLLEIRSPN